VFDAELAELVTPADWGSGFAVIHFTSENWMVERHTQFRIPQDVSGPDFEGWVIVVFVDVDFAEAVNVVTECFAEDLGDLFVAA
jgi:hypothetical protein